MLTRPLVRGARKWGPIALAVTALLAFTHTAEADNVLRRGRTGTSASSSGDAAARAAQAAAAAQHAQRSVAQGLDAIRRARKAQDDARASALGRPADVPNGLAGLVVAPETSANPTPWQGASSPQAQTGADGRTSVTITQKDAKAILSWSTFDVGKETDVYFDQTAGGENAASWIALNRVLDPLGAPSQILGSIRAEGQVYIINRNGILFGGTSQVNVATLVASSLDLVGETLKARNQRFLDGILAPSTATLEQRRAFVADWLEGTKPTRPSSSEVIVDVGAKLSVGHYGQVLLLAAPGSDPSKSAVENRGSIEAPDGQVLLAAGRELWLDQSGNRFYDASTNYTGGVVANTGLISTPRGNITLLGVDLQQRGVLTATTSVDANGSVQLGETSLWSGVEDSHSLAARLSRRPDPVAVTFAKGSVTQVLPDEESKKAVGMTSLRSGSTITATGDRIDVMEQAALYAPSGVITLDAKTNSGRYRQTGGHVIDGQPDGDATRVYLEVGSVIDVSGLSHVDVAMEQNSVMAQLRASELRDNPLLRDSPLRGATIYFDARRGGQGVADLSAYDGLIERDIAQLMTNGGTVNLRASEIIMRKGSLIDLSGGSLGFRDGYVRHTMLVDPTGRLVPIERALAGVAYAGLDGSSVASHPRWGLVETFSSGLSRSRPHFERGYVQGGAAGTLTIGTNTTSEFAFSEQLHGSTQPHQNLSATGAIRILDGEVVARTVVGPRQRDPATRPAGATLSLSQAGDVSFTTTDVPIEPGFAFDTPFDAASFDHRLPTRWFNDGSTFTNVTIVSGYTSLSSDTAPSNVDVAPGGHLTLALGTTIDLGQGGSFSYSGKRVSVDGTLRAPGGTIKLTANYNDPSGTPTVRLGSTGVIDVAGRFSNDLADSRGATQLPALNALNGGQATLFGISVDLAPGSLIDASGGARLDAKGSTLTAGSAGSISITGGGQYAHPLAGTSDVGGSLVLGGELVAYSLATTSGGALTIGTLSDVVIADEGRAPGRLTLSPKFFARGGFSSYTLNGRSLTLDMSLTPSVETLVLAGASTATQAPIAVAAALASGTRLDEVARREVLPESVAVVPMQFVFNNLNAQDGDIKIGPAGSITMNQGSGSSVRLGGRGRADVYGTIVAQGGTISLTGSTVELHSGSKLLADGYQKSVFDGVRAMRSVIQGGTIELDGTVLIDNQATVDASGSLGTADLLSPHGRLARSPYAAVPVAGDAGSITISTAQGSLVAGKLWLGAGGEGGAGGTLTINSVATPLVVVRSEGAQPSETTATVAAGSINSSGADNLRLELLGGQASTELQGNSPVVVEAGVTLRTNRSIVVEAFAVMTTPSQSGTVTLDSPYVRLQGATSLQPQPELPLTSGGGASLLVAADLIDLSGLIWLGCASANCGYGSFETARLSSSGDIRASTSGRATSSHYPSGLLSTGEIVLSSAQVYVTSIQQFDQSAVGSPDSLVRLADDPGFLITSSRKIAVEGTNNDHPPPVPLSFGERLTLRAPSVVQGGVVRAPQGQVFIEGTEVVLEKGSLTSTSLEHATVPFGEVVMGPVFVGYQQGGQSPAKTVQVTAARVDVREGAVVDVSGGGDVLGYGFVSGNGGSSDILSKPRSYAVLPSLGESPVPRGGVKALDDASLSVGDSVYLQGVPGLRDGYYALLPAHYALLPGGLLIRELPGAYASAPVTLEQPDGAVVAAGKPAVALGEGPRDTGPGWQRFLVMSQGVFLKYSNLQTFSFNDYAAKLASETGVTVRIPNDAGSLVVKVLGTVDTGASLSLLGTGKFSGGPGGLQGNLDISASKIALVAPGSPFHEQGSLMVDSDSLSRFGAASVLVGGTRTLSATQAGTVVNVDATDVVVATSAASPLSGSEVILVARDRVSVAPGSVVRAEGVASRDEAPLILQRDDSALTGNDSALLRLSTGTRVGVVRGETRGAAGVVEVGENVALSGSGSLALDGTQQVALGDRVTFSAPRIDLASRRVNLGDGVDSEGTTLGTKLLTELASSSDLLIRAYDSVHLYSDLTLGSLCIDTGLLQGHGSTKLKVGDLTLRASGPTSAVGITGTGDLSLDLIALHLGPGKITVAGYRALTGRATILEAQGTGELDLSGRLSLVTGQVQTKTGVAYTLSIDGDVSLTGGSGSAASLEGLGGRLTLLGASINLDTAVVLPAGSFTATATSGSVTLGNNALVDVGGRAVDFEDQARFAPGGNIALIAAKGELTIAEGAVLDVSGSSRGGAAGAIELVAAQGTASIRGALHGSATEGFSGGRVTLDAAGLGTAAATDFTALNGLLEAGGFSASRQIRLRQQDITVEAGQVVTAGEVVLQSDNGLVTVAGTINAAGTSARADGGRIRLVGGAGVLLDGVLDAHAYAGTRSPDAFQPASPKVELIAEGGRVTLAQGSRVDASGGRLVGGEVVLRAPRTTGDVDIDPIQGTIAGEREVVVQGLERYAPSPGNVVDAALIGRMTDDAKQWMSSAGAIAARLAGSDSSLSAHLQIAPAMEVTSSGDLRIGDSTTPNGISLNDGQTSGGPGYLGFVANGKIDVTVAVSDGFSSALPTAPLLSGRSFALSFESEGDITVKPNVRIRTGTGDISMRAGGDITLADATSVIYTAGTKSGWAAGFKGGPAGATLGEFPSQGGDIDLKAQGDIVAKVPSQTTSAWLFRYGNSAARWVDEGKGELQTSWSIIYRNFQQAVAALGGGDVRVTAGGDISQLQVSIPTTGQQTSEGGLLVRGGGDLWVSAGRNLVGGLFMLGEGHAELRAGGAVSRSTNLEERVSVRSTATGSDNDYRTLGVLFGLMDATFGVTAALDVDIEGAFDPMKQGQIAGNLYDCRGGQCFGSGFSGYSNRTALDVMSVAGSVTYENNPWASTDLSVGKGYSVKMSGDAIDGLTRLFSRAPPSLRLVSMESSIALRGSGDPNLTLASADRGTLQLLAREDLVLGVKSLKMEDVTDRYRFGPLNSFATLNGAAIFEASYFDDSNPSRRGETPIHQEDRDPVRFYALEGSVCGDPRGQCAMTLNKLLGASLTFPKPIDVFAGKDVFEGKYVIQNNGPTDLSQIRAGRDIYDVAFEISGEGAAVLEAGRNVHLDYADLSTTQLSKLEPTGLILSQGGASNPTLEENRAADLYVMAGTVGGVEWSTFADTYLDPANAKHVTRTYLPELASYMEGLGVASLTDAELVAAFRLLPMVRQKTFLSSIYFAELKEAGIEYNAPGSTRFHSYQRGLDAVSRLFSGNRAISPVGDIIFNAKPVETKASGSIAILAPYGRVAVGAEKFDTSRSALGGVVTRRGGDIRIMAEQNIDLFTSRVFTMQGGDIEMWTTIGSITAGAGSKTAVFDAPLRYVMNNDGVVTIDVFGLQTGAGIGVLDALQNAKDRRRSRMDLIAPRGEVNAGDAGIRVVGDLNIAARAVVGLDNIQVSGISVGVPRIETPNIGALTSASQLAQAATKEGVGPESAAAAAAARKTLAELPSIITVEVVGYETPSGGDRAQPKKKKTR